MFCIVNRNLQLSIFTFAMEKSKKINAKLLAVDVAECAIFVALMTAGAFIKIPFPLVPLTFQTVICVLAGLLLGWKKGAISMAVYCFMGLVGIPVFASGGGIFYVLMPTFGYIIGFVVAALVAGLIGGKAGLPVWRYIVAAAAAFISNYAVGVPYCMVVVYLQGMNDLLTVFITWNLYYMPKDLVLCLLAAVLAWRVLPHIKNGRNKLKQTANTKKKEKNDSN